MKAFTLIEVLIYTALTAVIGMLMTGILLSVSQVHIRESASTEVTGQLNFVTQTIGRLVRTASNIEIDAGVSTSTIKLRMQDDSKDPTCISLVSGVIKLAEGPGTNLNDCTTTTSDLTNTRVIVNALNFKKFVQYPGHDTVSYDVQMTYNSQNPKAQVQRSLSSAIARVSAATFDSSILPGSVDYEIGQTGSAWKNLYLSGVLNLGTSATDPVIAQNGSIYYNTATNKFKGYASSTWANIGGDLWTASSTAIYYNNGNVGIGTAGPTSDGATDGPMLHMSGGVQNTEIRMVGASSLTDMSILTDEGLHFRDNISNLRRVSILTGGNVGIGTTGPANKLHVVSDTTRLTPTSYPGAFGSASTPAKKVLIGWDNANDVGIISPIDEGVLWKSLVLVPNAGNVGIGTTNPGEKLDIQNGRLKLKSVVMDYATGADPACPAGSGAPLMRKWTAVSCSSDCAGCTTPGIWATTVQTCLYMSYGGGSLCNVPLQCTGGPWTEVVCLGN